jgi:FkbM family methyltransferase
MDAADLRELHGVSVSEAPWYFRLGRYLARNNIRGGHRLVDELRRIGLLDRLVSYPLTNGVKLHVPLWRPSNCWDATDVNSYEVRFLRLLASAVRRLPRGVTFVDCGADIGTVSAMMVSRCTNISSVIAFEPNRAAHNVLAKNLATFRIHAEARNVAVGEFCGRGRLTTPSVDRSAHAAYIVPAADGDIAVQRVDDLALAVDAPCVIKIDVEGSELDVVHGAARTIAQAGELLVAFEAHPKVAARTRQDPIEVVQALLATGRDWDFEVDVDPLFELDPDRPLFEQLPATRVYNVIAHSPVRSS